MNKADVNRRVLAIQAKKKRHKNNKKRGKQNGQEQQSNPGQNLIPNSQSNRSSENLQAPDNANNSHADAPISAAFRKVDATATASTSSGGSGGTPEQYQPSQSQSQTQSLSQSQVQVKSKSKSSNSQKEHLQQQQQQAPRSSSNESYESEMNSENEEQELKEDYCKGGYHPVNIGDLFQGKAPVSPFCMLAPPTYWHFPTRPDPKPKKPPTTTGCQRRTAQINRTHSGWFSRPPPPPFRARVVFVEARGRRRLPRVVATTTIATAKRFGGGMSPPNVVANISPELHPSCLHVLSIHFTMPAAGLPLSAFHIHFQALELLAKENPSNRLPAIRE